MPSTPTKSLTPTLTLLLITTLCLTARAASFQSDWQHQNNRVWLGRQYWANPMEDWTLNNGRIECLSNQGNRNVHILTHQLQGDGNLTTTVRLGLIKKGKTGSAGFKIAIHDDINDYRGNCFWGTGITAGIATDNKLILGNKNQPLDNLPLNDLTLKLEIKPAQQNQHTLTLTAIDTATEKSLAQITNQFDSSRLVGNIALVNNFDPKAKNASRFWFSHWTIDGSMATENQTQTFGPILWAMHTLSNSRTTDGYVMKMTAQMPPMGPTDSQTVQLQIQKTPNTWTTLGNEQIDPDARTATFRIPNWPATKDVPYRLAYTMTTTDQQQKDHYYTGTVRKEPLGRPLVIGGFTCQFWIGFPYAPIEKNAQALNPDILYFSGDQIYEGNGGYGIIRTPADRSILNYLRKWYLFGWAFGDLMRDRPTLCTPDDHDVYQGNLWGNGGNPVAPKDHDAGGYIQPAQMVNVVHKTNTSHHPDLYDPTPIQQDISVYYGDMVYGRVSFAVVSDRMFKSGPRDTVTDWPGRPDILEDITYDLTKLDKPGLVLLGDRQLNFLEHWVGDWRGADMKILLSQTVFSQVNTHTGGHDEFVQGDLDANGWPQSARNRAIKTIRKGFPLHINGDQHLTTLIQYGVDAQRDGVWSFCTPAISICWQRWWRPDEIGRPHQNRPAHNLPNTGEYLDGFDNKVYVYALGNPPRGYNGNRYEKENEKMAGFGLVRADCDKRTYTVESYRFITDVTDSNTTDDQFPGFPHTIAQTENYSRTPAGYLDPVTYKGIPNPVVKVYDNNNKLVYALRLKPSPSNTTTFKPWIFQSGTYTIKIGNPDTNSWQTYERKLPNK